MPFGLTNALATFQRLMCTAFKEYLNDFLEIFMDDLCVHTNWLEHLKSAGEGVSRVQALLHFPQPSQMPIMGETWSSSGAYSV